MRGVKNKVKPKLQFKVSRKKLCRALQRLQKLRSVTTTNERNIPRLHGTVNKQLNTHAYVQPIGWKQNWMEIFKTSITKHDWDIFIRTLRLASQNYKFCGLDNVLRNSFFGTLTHPMYSDQKTLRLLLYTIAPCRNEHDIEFCIETISRVFNSGRDPINIGN
ncbi:uncharacterized protein LOC126567708 [Anopheles maculipalpis]|uniref:uncharacterized protein LOC126567708 n=1 Tax=Anopheles maculipalpis TaxID=1496333 RepID=UPI002159149B|nr:uncharacterized protein LOC126567708 [Anopheles maculipalpis]